jgi:hypothetical protein
MSEMADEEVNVRLAEATGWTFQDHHKKSRGLAWIVEIKSPDGLSRGSYFGDDVEDRQKTIARCVPLYCSDLNACAKVEAGLNDTYPNHQSYDYIDNLRKIVGGVPNCPAQFCATAPQRARALLATLQSRT